MRRTSIVAIAIIIAGAFAASGTVNARQGEEGEELREARSELEAAREQLEAAAREVARLSAEVAGPIVGDMVRQFWVPGRRAMLGISIDDSDEGVVVVGVSPGGPADESGVETGDVIVAMDGAELTGSEGRSPSEVLIAQMGNVDPGDPVALTVRRDGTAQDIEVETRAFAPPGRGFARRGEPGRWAEGDFTARVPPPFDFMRPMGRWGDMELAELSPGLGAYFGAEAGILVVRAPADEALQLQDGDVILEIGGRVPNSTAHAMRILASFEPGETLELTIMRERRRQTLELDIPPSRNRG